MLPVGSLLLIRGRFRHPAARPATRAQQALLAVLGLLLLISLLLPVLRVESWYYPHYGLTFGQQARLDTLGLVWKNDEHGSYAVIDSNWTFYAPLPTDGVIRYHLMAGDRQASYINLQPGAEQGLRGDCSQRQPCAVHVAGSIRVLQAAVADHYRLTASLAHEQGDDLQPAQTIRTLGRSGVELPRTALSLLASLLLCTALLHLLLPVLRQGLRWRIAGSLLLANVSFLLLHATVCFDLPAFLVWAEYRLAHYYLALGLLTAGWLSSVLIGRHLMMGILFNALAGLALLANFTKILIYGTALGGDDLSNLGSLLTILTGAHLWLWSGGLLLSLLIGWRLGWLGGLLRTGAVLVAFFGFSVLATQTSDRVLGPNVNYFNTETSYQRDLVRRGPSIYLFDLIAGMVRGSSIYRFPAMAPLPSSPRVLADSAAAGTAAWDVVVVMQYEAMWLGWQGGICQPAPTLQPPPGSQALMTTLRSPTTGGMTVLAEFEMNTGLPVGLLRQGIVPDYYLQSDAHGLARTASQLGYQTHFFHPFKATFWGRNLAIPALGYQTQHFEDSFPPLQQKGLYISDHALVQQVLAQVTAGPAPQFIYAVTMQGHGPFNQDRYGPQTRHAACAGEAEAQILDTYYTGVVDEMASLQELADALQASGKRYLLLAFGDHQPFLMGAAPRVLPPHPASDQMFTIPFFALTSDPQMPLARQYAGVRQLFQAGQVTRQLLGDAYTPPQVGQALLHPVLGQEQGFTLGDYQPLLQRVFRAETFHH